LELVLTVGERSEVHKGSVQREAPVDVHRYCTWCSEISSP